MKFIEAIPEMLSKRLSNGFQKILRYYYVVEGGGGGGFVVRDTRRLHAHYIIASWEKEESQRRASFFFLCKILIRFTTVLWYAYSGIYQGCGLIMFHRCAVVYMQWGSPGMWKHFV